MLIQSLASICTALVYALTLSGLREWGDIHTQGTFPFVDHLEKYFYDVFKFTYSTKRRFIVFG